MNSNMKRREFLRTATGLGATLGILGGAQPAIASDATPQPCAEPAFPQIQKLTATVAEFVLKTRLTDIPSDVLELGKKSILDAFGLALSGSKAETAVLIAKYVDSLGSQRGGATVLGSTAKFATRFAALAN